MSYAYTVPSAGPYINQDFLVTNPTIPAFTINGLAPLSSGARDILVCGSSGTLPVVANTSLFSSFCGGYKWVVWNSDEVGTTLNAIHVNNWTQSFDQDILSDAIPIIDGLL